jgi:His-Xaa-Ser system protein HxsD
MKTVSLDARVYKIDDVHRAVYKFADRVSAEIAMSDDSLKIVVQLSPLLRFKGDLDMLVQELNIELSDQTLRRIVRAETEAIRNVILAHTFSNVGRK